MKRTISVMVGKGSVNHNSRKFHAKNTDPERSHLNVEYCNEDIRDVYHELFEEARIRYNAKQRKDRQVKDYYEKIASGKQEKPFHEIILQIGNKDDMGAKTEDGQLAAKILDDYMKDFQQRNPTLRVFSAHLHMDEATPHLHIDFIPFITESKRAMDTRVSSVMERYGIEWEQKGTHEKHLSVLDFQKQERAKEVANLEERKAELLEENSAFEAINGALCDQLAQVNEELDSSEEKLSQSRQEADKAKKQADKYQKRINELAPMVKNMERLAAEFSANPEELLPEAIIVETGKAYREKKAKPLVEKIVKVLRSVYSAFLDLSNRFERLQESYSRERSRNEHLKGRLQETIDENRELRETAEDMECIKAVFGSQKVEEAISQAKQQEKIERERKQTMKKKYDREAI